MNSRSLSARQQRFVAEYLVDGNGQRAAIAAGYGVAGAAVAAHRLLSNAKVKIVLHGHQKAHAQRLMVKREDMADALFDAADMARAQRNPMALIAATRALIKLFGLDAPVRLAVDLSPKPSHHFSRLSDAELVALIAGGTS